MISAVIYKNCNLTKQFGTKILSNEFLGSNIMMPLVIVWSSLGPVKGFLEKHRILENTVIIRWYMLSPLRGSSCLCEFSLIR